MSWRHTLITHKNRDHTQGSRFELFIFLGINGLPLLVGAGSFLNYLFPASSFLLAIRFYYQYPIQYFSLVWWMWFLSPLVRRLVDFQSAYREPSPVLLAPALVTLVSVLTLLRKFPKRGSDEFYLHMIAVIGVLYGACIGAINYHIVSVGIKSLKWLLPVAFGIHIYLNWARYPAFRKSLEKTFTWGVAIMGAYGIYQYIAAPGWDRKWLINSGLLGFQGIPEPFGMRVWSTMDSGEPFGAMMAGGLIFLLSRSVSQSLLVSIPGYLSFLLATIRTAWFGWIAGLLILLTSITPKQQLRLVALMTILLALLIPLSQSSPFSEVINSRLDTLANLESDHSLSARQMAYGNLLGKAATSLFGQGIGDKTYDSAVLATLFNLGWLGTLLYFGSLFLLVVKLFNSKHSAQDYLIGASKAVVATALVRIPFNVPMLEASGILLWGFISLGLAAERYARVQREKNSSIKAYHSYKVTAT